MPVALTVEDDRWQALDLAALAAQVAEVALGRLGLDAETCEISLLACDDTRIAALNTEFRDKPVPTNVLSWPAEDLAPAQAGDAPHPPQPDFTGEIELGDIAIAWETCAREAAEQDKPMRDHVAHLLLHGLLHLLGYDHIRDPDATLMEGLETEILGILGVPDPYRDEKGP